MMGRQIVRWAEMYAFHMAASSFILVPYTVPLQAYPALLSKQPPSPTKSDPATPPPKGDKKKVTTDS